MKNIPRFLLLLGLVQLVTVVADCDRHGLCLKILSIVRTLQYHPIMSKESFRTAKIVKYVRIWSTATDRSGYCLLN